MQRVKNTRDFLIFKNILKLTSTGAIISIILIGLFAWWFQTSWVYILGYAGISLVALVSLPLLYRLFGYRLQDELNWLKNRELKEHYEMLDRLKAVTSELTKLNNKEGMHQAKVLTDIIEDYHHVVETRFMGNEHGPLSYLSSARTVQLNALQNLTDMVAIDHSISSIMRNKLDEESVITDQIQQRQDKQITLREGQGKRMEELVEENRKLFNALMETAVEVANIPSFSKFERIHTLSRLVSLAEVTKLRK
ncbi:hypothetical protein [uncultured Cocleimonas sp.]|uniref:hypothetical protein n=1 Tax=uncultured Cocleimonas sp. TaxID=1051587 RepID=UPI00261FF507|nr:hypothetical protein [uncultured Cocleimonas sp.]